MLCERNILNFIYPKATNIILSSFTISIFLSLDSVISKLNFKRSLQNLYKKILRPISVLILNCTYHLMTRSPLPFPKRVCIMYLKYFVNAKLAIISSSVFAKSSGVDMSISLICASPVIPGRTL